MVYAVTASSKLLETSRDYAMWILEFRYYGPQLGLDTQFGARKAGGAPHHQQPFLTLTNLPRDSHLQNTPTYSRRRQNRFIEEQDIDGEGQHCGIPN